MRNTRIVTRNFPSHVGPSCGNTVRRLCRGGHLNRGGNVNFCGCRVSGHNGPGGITSRTACRLLGTAASDSGRAFSSRTVVSHAVLTFYGRAMHYLRSGVIDAPSRTSVTVVVNINFPPFHNNPYHCVSRVNLSGCLTLYRGCTCLNGTCRTPRGVHSVTTTNRAFCTATW